MTTTIKRITVSNGVSNFSINIDVDKFENCYHVRAARKYEDGTAGYYFTDLTYPTVQKAQARFNYLKRRIENKDIT